MESSETSDSEDIDLSTTSFPPYPQEEKLHYIFENEILIKTGEPSTKSEMKVSVIGAGKVGLACLGSIFLEEYCNELVLIERDTKRAHMKLMDMLVAESFMKRTKLSAGVDPKLTADSDIIIITSGVRQKVGETRLNLLQRNADIFKQIIPDLVKFSPDAVLLIVTNPVDVMTYAAWKISGLPKQRVIGSGTNLDTSRFRFLISDKIGLSTEHVHAWIIGEHGDSSVPVWSSANLMGTRLRAINPKIGTADDSEDWSAIHKKVITSAYEVIKLKGYTSWAIGFSVAELVKLVLRNTQTIVSVTTDVQGSYDIDKEIFLSVPCILGRSGITHIVQLDLIDAEKRALCHSADILYEMSKQLVL